MQVEILFQEAEEIIRLCKTFREYVEWGEVSWLTDSEAIEFVISQIKIFESVSKLVHNNRFTEGFILIRTVFENYFIISLILNGTKYKRKYIVERNSDETQEQAYKRLEEKINLSIKNGRKDIISFKPTNKYKYIEIIHTGYYSVDQERLIPAYYFVFKEYDPIKHRIDKIKSISSKDLFPEHKEKWQKHHQYLYRYYLNPKNLIECAILNDIITKDQKIRFNVHYNFLSGFTHLTNKGHELTSGYLVEKKYHFLKELSLLYVIMLSNYYLNLLINYFNRINIKIKDINRFNTIIKKTNNLCSYFWFIYNSPSDFDKHNYVTLKTFHKSKMKHLDDTIPYYKDPFERLKSQHRPTYELSTGLKYDPPWPIHTKYLY